LPLLLVVLAVVWRWVGSKPQRGNHDSNPA